MSWKRLEAGPAAHTLREALAARIADPLWMISRQWVTGELTGEDAGRPLWMEFEVESVPITARAASTGDLWEPAVEAQSDRDGARFRRAAESGARLLRRLSGGDRRVVREKLQARYPLPRPKKFASTLSESEARLMLRRSFDGLALHVAVSRGDTSRIAGENGVPVEVIKNWWSEEEAMFGALDVDARESAWSAEKMTYEAQLAVVGGKGDLRTNRYDGRRLDWFSFEGRGLAPRESETHTHEVFASPVSFAGMPASRWWAFEDRRVRFAELQTQPDDLARMVVASFATSYGNDWWVLPFRSRFGQLTRVTRVSVRDTFDRIDDIRSAAENDGPTRTWRFFELDDGPGSPWCLLPDVLTERLDGPVVEEIDFVRDETANLVWVRERRVQDDAGTTFEIVAETLDGPQPAGWSMRISSTVPDGWVPLLPVRLDGGGEQIRLMRGRVAHRDSSRGAQAQLLEPHTRLLVREDAVAAHGLHLVRAHQRARTRDGGIVVWLGHQRREGTSVRRGPDVAADRVHVRPGEDG